MSSRAVFPDRFADTGESLRPATVQYGELLFSAGMATHTMEAFSRRRALKMLIIRHLVISVPYGPLLFFVRTTLHYPRNILIRSVLWKICSVSRL